MQYSSPISQSVICCNRLHLNADRKSKIKLLFLSKIMRESLAVGASLMQPLRVNIAFQRMTSKLNHENGETFGRAYFL